MSAKANATVVAMFVTKARKGQGVEVRVTSLRSIKDVRHEPDYPQAWCRVLNRGKVREMFAGARIFYDLTEARSYALRVQRKTRGGDQPEILELNFATVHFPASDRKRSRRHLQRSRS